MMTDRARRTIALCRSICQQHGLPVAEVVARLTGGMETYGCENHLSSGFDAAGETLAELDDCAAFAALLVARGTVTYEDPLLATYCRHIALARAAMVELLTEPPDAA
jgi:hypothetical protein